jgi:hypothetical protein
MVTSILRFLPFLLLLFTRQETQNRNPFLNHCSAFAFVLVFDRLPLLLTRWEKKTAKSFREEKKL